MDKSVEQPLKINPTHNLIGPSMAAPMPPIPMNNNNAIPTQVNNNPNIVGNQLPLPNNTIQVVNVIAQKFGTAPVSITCQFCKAPITTLVSKSLNIWNCLLCLFTSLLCWVCIQCIRKKEIHCLDAEHKCPNCGNTLGYYTSC